MAARYGQKLKLLHIIDILKKYSDEEHPLSAAVLCEKLSERGVTAERKAIYSDIEQLIDYGYDIIKTRTPKIGCFLASREFEIPEIYLLTDAVRSAGFISAKKTRELVSKLDDMLSIHQSRRREKKIYFESDSKCANEEIFYTIDEISRAIEDNRKITFRYGTRVLNENRELSFKYKEMTVSPYAMTWKDDHYYLIGNYDKYDNLLHLRIDRMRSVNETDIPARHFSEVSDYTDSFNVADYTKRLFSMYGGENEDVKLRCEKSVLEQVADRFPTNVFITNVTDTHFDIRVNANISEAFVTWIMNYGNRIEVLSPEHLANKIKSRAEQIINIYKNKQKTLDLL